MKRKVSKKISEGMKRANASRKHDFKFCFCEEGEGA